MSNILTTSSDSTNQLLRKLRYDLPASLVVFLVALPLCLGIALASGAPLFSGLVAGVVGGTLVGLLSGSEVSVSGPAAGLTVIVASGINTLGTFEAFLLAVTFSGILQLLLGFVKAGIIGNYVPNSVIKGMLAAIGVVIILKQIPHALGRDSNFVGDFDFFETESGTSNTILDIIKAIYSFSPAALLITLTSLALMLTWETKLLRRFRMVRLVPAPLLVVVIGVLINEYFRLSLSDLYLRTEDGHLVMVPISQGFRDFLRYFTQPDWSAWSNKDVYSVALSLAIVGSIETLLSLEAADKLDPYRRISDTNRELKAQGIGNLISGILGGLPVTSVIVRTSANAYAGSRTRLSSIFHGLLILISVLTIPMLLNKIPLACLAAILLVIGYKLTKLEIYRDMYAAGLDQFLPFIITVVAIVVTDLLTGITVGMVVGFFFVIRTNHHAAITIVSQDAYYLVRFNKDLSFINKNELKEKLMRIPANANLIIDGTRSTFIDNDIYDVVKDFEENAKFRNISIELKHFHSKAQNFRN